MILVSVSLLTYNGRRFIKNCLNSVLNQTYPKIEILIIDNGSSDGTVNVIREVITNHSPKFLIRIIQNKQNLGFSAGHNLGVKESRGELICFLNQDVVLAPDCIEKMARYFEKEANGSIGSLQAKLLKLNKDLKLSNIIDTTGFVIFKNRRIINRGQGEIDKGQFEQIEEVFGADGAAPVYRRKALEEIKISNFQFPISNFEYFDEDFFMYKEDVDLAWRLRLSGFKSIFLPEARAWHARGAGESAATNYLSIIKERRKIGRFGKFLAFRNQRLMQIKNELPGLFFKHLPWILFKEIGAWLYVILFEPYTLKAVKELIKLAPKAWGKRKIIMARKKLSTREMEKWFI